MRIGISQMNARVGDLEVTCEWMIDESSQAAAKDVDLMVFPLPLLLGVDPFPDSAVEGLVIDLMGTLADLAAGLRCPALVSAVIGQGDALLPMSFLIKDGDVNIVGVSNPGPAEQLLPHMPSVKGAPPELPSFVFGNMRFGMAYEYDDLDLYCEDAGSVDAVIYLPDTPYTTSDVTSALGADLVEGGYLSAAQDSRAWIVGANAVGTFGCSVFTGGSFVVTPTGELSAVAPNYRDALLVADVRPGFEGRLKRALTPEVFDPTLFLWNSLSFGLRDFCEKAEVEQVCVLVDGSLQSSVVAALAVDALGPTNVHGVVAKGVGHNVATAREVVRNLRIEAVDVVAPSRGSQAFARDCAQAFLADRARATRSMPLSNLDLTAICLEDFSGRVDAGTLAPLGSVLRRDVIDLAHLRNTYSPAIPEAALADFRVPSLRRMPKRAGAAEDRLAFCDYVLLHYVDHAESVSEACETTDYHDFVEEVVERFHDCDLGRHRAPASLALTFNSLSTLFAPVNSPWRDTCRSDDDLVPLLGDLGDAPVPVARTIDLAGAPKPADEPPEAVREKEVRETLEFLRDFSEGGGLFGKGSDDGEKGDGAFGDMGTVIPGPWSGPFSEN